MKENKETNLLPITNDYVFKRVFSYKGNEDVLIDLLEAILKKKIKSLEVKNPEILSEKIDGKKFILDIKAELDDKTTVDIEMQTINEHNIEERSTVYASRSISEQLQTGERYKDLNKSIFIGILNFEYYKRNSYYHIVRQKFEKVEEEYYVDMGYKEENEPESYIEMHYIELPKYYKKKPKIRSKLDEWLYLFIGERGKIEMAKKENKKIEKAVDTLERISLTPKEREMYEAVKQIEFLQRIGENNFRKEVLKEVRKEGVAQGMAQGMAQGRAQGRLEIQKNIAKNMIEEGLKIDLIEKLTGLNKIEINKLKK